MENARHRTGPLATTSSAIAILTAALLALGGCSNEVVPPEATGSWIEIRELAESEDALDVEQESAFDAVEVLDDRLVFTFDGASPLRVGHVVAGHSDGGYLRRIESLRELSDGRIEATTTHAALPEYYEQLSFVFHYRPRRVEDLPADAVEGLAAASLVEGCEDVTPCDLSGNQRFGSDTAGCTASYEASLHAGPFFETDLTADLEFDHGVGVGWDVWHPTVDLDPDAYFVIDGSVRAGVRLDASGRADLSCNADFAALLGGGTAPEVPLAVLAIGPIPITVTGTPVLSGSFTASADAGDLHAELGAAGTLHAEFGVRDGEPHHPTPALTFDSFATLETTNAGSVSAHGTLIAGVKLKLTVGHSIEVEVAGASAEVTVGASGTADITGTLSVDLTTDTAGCSWNVDLPWSVDAAFRTDIALRAEALGEGVDWTWDYTWDPIRLFEGALPSRSGAIEWCGGGTEMCDGADVACHDDYLDNGVCAGMPGYRRCEGEQVQHCTCTVDGWTSCGECMTL